MIGLENRGETLIFMSRHFDETMTILILQSLRFCALTILTGDCNVLRIYKITCSKKENGMFYSFQYFSKHFSHSVIFPVHLYRVAYKWRIDKIKYQQVNGYWNIVSVHLYRVAYNWRIDKIEYQQVKWLLKHRPSSNQAVFFFFFFL